MPTWTHATGVLTLDRPRILGVVNVTPDSFSDGGMYLSVDAAVARAERLVAEGADVVDVGGESTRPQGATPVSVSEELRRVLPVVEAMRARLGNVPISVDTVKSEVAEAVLSAGASIINDVSGFRLDPRMGDVCARYGAGVVLMHSRGDVAEMATFVHATYDADVVAEVAGELRSRVAAAVQAGVASANIVLDPGIGFSKRSEHSLAVLAGIGGIAALGRPVLVGASRKRFVGELTAVSAPADRAVGSAAAHAAALERGARLFRAHDVRVNREALAVTWAVMSAGAAGH